MVEYHDQLLFIKAEYKTQIEIVETTSEIIIL